MHYQFVRLSLSVCLKLLNVSIFQYCTFSWPPSLFHAQPKPPSLSHRHFVFFFVSDWIYFKYHQNAIKLDRICIASSRQHPLSLFVYNERKKSCNSTLKCEKFRSIQIHSDVFKIKSIVNCVCIFYQSSAEQTSEATLWTKEKNGKEQNRNEFQIASKSNGVSKHFKIDLHSFRIECKKKRKLIHEWNSHIL